jgi:hypothetical protein
MGNSRSNYYDDYGDRIRHNPKDVNKTRSNKHRKQLYKYSGNRDSDEEDYIDNDTNRKY